MKTYATFLLIVGMLAACETNNPTSITHTTGASAGAPDNPSSNVRQRSAAATAMDQGTDQADLDVARDIRQALMANAQLSLSAKDVTVIANAGVVILRGTVHSADEKRTIEARVGAYADNYVLDDQLELAPEK